MTDDYRKEIDAADESIMRAFRTRLCAVEKIARYKRTHALPVEDAEREAAMLSRKEDSQWEYALMRSLLDISKKYQKSLYNIYLIGMPYSGKSTLLHALGNLSEREPCDTDAVVEQKLHMSIPQIFETLGEEKFRDAETEVLKECAGKGCMTVSAGGGIITREENIAVMKNSGIIVLCDRPLEELFTSFESDKERKRPLVQSRDDLGLLYFERFRTYRENADIIINTDKAGAAQSVLDFAREAGLSV